MIQLCGIWLILKLLYWNSRPSLLAVDEQELSFVVKIAISSGGRLPTALLLIGNCVRLCLNDFCVMLFSVIMTITLLKGNNENSEV